MQFAVSIVSNLNPCLPQAACKSFTGRLCIGAWLFTVEWCYKYASAHLSHCDSHETHTLFWFKTRHPLETRIDGLVFIADDIVAGFGFVGATAFGFTVDSGIDGGMVGLGHGHSVHLIQKISSLAQTCFVGLLHPICSGLGLVFQFACQARPRLGTRSGETIALRTRWQHHHLTQCAQFWLAQWNRLHRTLGNTTLRFEPNHWHQCDYLVLDGATNRPYFGEFWF